MNITWYDIGILVSINVILLLIILAIMMHNKQKELKRQIEYKKYIKSIYTIKE